MGSVGGMLGLSGGGAGSGFAGPQQANLQTPTTDQQVQDSYTANQNALQQQASFLQALQGQNGIQNQNNVYSQLQGVANGTGPNPAQAQLAQATGANNASTAALMAGQRGAGSNAGLIARQAIQQGAANNQNAAGQAATLQAQQSLNALSGMGALAGQQVGNLQNATAQNTSAQQNEQNMLLNGVAGQNSARVGSQASYNGANAGLISNSQGQQSNLIGNIAGGAGSALNLFAGGGAVQKMADGGLPQAVGYDPNNHDPVFDQQVQPGVQSAVAPPPVIPMPSAIIAPSTTKGTAPSSRAAQFFSGATQPSSQVPQGMGAVGQLAGKAIGTGLNALVNAMRSPESQLQHGTYQGDTQTTDVPVADDGQAYAANGGKVKAMVSAGERYLPPQAVAEVAEGKKSPMKAGQKIPGKPKVGGAVDSYDNDTIPKTLEEGGIVLPRSVTQAKNPEWAAHKFVRDVLAKKKGL